jgi:SlyX protein
MGQGEAGEAQAAVPHEGDPGAAEERLVALEIRLTQQQALLDDLSGVLHEQQRELELLRLLVQRLVRRLDTVEERVPQAPSEKPPHY